MNTIMWIGVFVMAASFSYGMACIIADLLCGFDDRTHSRLIYSGAAFIGGIAIVMAGVFVH